MTRQDGSRSQHRGIAMGQGGIVAAASPLAISYGLQALEQGGTAMDAALAAAFVTTVVLPDQCGIGGDAFILFYDAKLKTVTSIIGAGVSPMGLTADYFLEQGIERMPLYGIHAISVPGAVAAYQEGWKRYSRLTWKWLWQRAIGYARCGVPIGEVTAEHIQNEREKILLEPALTQLFWPNHRHLTAGDILYQPALAATLESIVESEGESFYRGTLGKRIVQTLKSRGSFFDGSEWMTMKAEVKDPFSITYRGKRVYTTPLPSQGFITLEALNLIEPFHLADYGYLNPRAIHLMAEALRRGFKDRLMLVEIGRDDVVRQLLDKKYAQRRIAEFGVDRSGSIGSDWARFLGDTTFIVSADIHGNVACLIHSLGHSFGSGIVAGDTGVLLNNRAGRGFSLHSGSNQLAPRKQTMHTLMAWMVTDEEGNLEWAGGTPGGDGQPQWNLQLLVDLIDWRLNVQEAVESPRWTLYPGTDSNVIGQSEEFRIEERTGHEVLHALRTLGYPLKIQSPWGAGGGAQIIARGAHGIWQGGSDPRVDGAVGVL